MAAEGTSGTDLEERATAAVEGWRATEGAGAPAVWEGAAKSSGAEAAAKPASPKKGTAFSKRGTASSKKGTASIEGTAGAGTGKPASSKKGTTAATGAATRAAPMFQLHPDGQQTARNCRGEAHLQKRTRLSET